MGEAVGGSEDVGVKASLQLRRARPFLVLLQQFAKGGALGGDEAGERFDLVARLEQVIFELTVPFQPSDGDALVGCVCYVSR